MSIEVLQADTLDWSRQQADDSVDLCFKSPPYEAARTYGIGFQLRGQDWVDWAVERFVEHYRICRGLVCWVIEGQTRNFQWSATPALLMADLHRRGIKLRKPPVYRRVGIPGSGGPDFLRNDYEFVVCASKGKLPWSENTAMGHIPKYAPGGEMSYRLTDGSRRNQWGGGATNNGSTNERKTNGSRSGKSRPGHVVETVATGRRVITRPRDGMHGGQENTVCKQPAIANPGNVIDCGAAGGGNMGSELCHENEAPFPESLAEFFIRSFCPPDGIVYDGFCGSGTTLAVAKRWGRNAIGTDIRESQVALTKRRIAEVQPMLPGMFGT